MLVTLFNWLHLVAATVWIGGLFFLLGVLKAGATPEHNSRFIDAAMRFRPWVWGAMAVVVMTGIYRIVTMGGMKALPVVLHIKITLALVMILISLVASVGLLPKAAAQPDATPKGYIWANVIVLVLGLTIFWLLEASGLV